MALATYRTYLATILSEKSTRTFMLLINFKDKGEWMLRAFNAVKRGANVKFIGRPA
jgi:hypothetical protein